MNDIEFTESESSGINLKKIPQRFNVFLVLCVLIAAFASMGDLVFSLGDAANVTLLVVFLYVVSRMIYHDVYVDNVTKAKASEEYTETLEEYKATASEIYSQGLATKLPDLCLRYRETELKAYRSELLSDEGIKYDLYEEKYRSKSKKELKGEGLSKSAIRCIRRADKAKGVYIAADTLLAGDYKPKHRGEIFLKSSERQQSKDEIESGIKALLKTFLVGVISISVVFDFTLQSIAQWAIRMMPIVTAALSAAPAGRKNVYNVAIPYLKNKTAILKTFLAWGNSDT